MKDVLNIALYQQDIAHADPEENFKRVGEAFAQMRELWSQPDSLVQERRPSGGKNAERQHESLSFWPDILIVPETFSTGFGEQMAQMAELPEGPSLAFARQMAAQYDALFVGTWTVRHEGKVLNRMHLVRPDGTYDYYDKAHTFRMSSEATQVARGTKKNIVEWKGWRLRPAICYDLRFPLWLRNYPSNKDVSSANINARLEYDVLLLSANWPSSRAQAWKTLIRARAIENQSYVVGSNRVGIDANSLHYSGDSAIIDYKGFPIAEAHPDIPQVITATLQKESLTSFRCHWPFFLDADVPEL